MNNNSQMIKFSEQVILYKQPQLFAKIQKLVDMEILVLNDKEKLFESEQADKYSILIIGIEQSDIINMALISCKYRYVFIMNQKHIKNDKFSRQNNSKFIEIQQFDNFNEKLQQVFIEYQKSLIKQRTALQIEYSWVDKRYYINIIYYQRLLREGDSWINKNNKSENMISAIYDFQAESERYINSKYVKDERLMELGLLSSIVDFLEENHTENDIMASLLLVYTDESFFYKMLQEYLRLQSIKNLYYIRLPMYYCLKGMQANQIIVNETVELFRGQHLQRKESSIYNKQKVGCRNIMLSFQSCSNEEIASGFITEKKEGLEQALLDFQGFTELKELESDFREMEKCLGTFVEVVLESKKKIDQKKVYQFKKQQVQFDDNQFGELKRQKQNIMEIFEMPYKHTQLIQAEFSLMYDRDPQFVIDILENEQFEGLDEAIRLSKLQIAYRMNGYRAKAIKYGEKAFLLSNPSNMEKDLQLRMELAWAYMDDQQFSVSFQRYKDCYFSENNRNVDYRAQILNNFGCIYWNLGQYKKAEQCQYSSKTIKDSMGQSYNLFSKSIARVNLYYAKLLVLLSQDIPDDIRCKQQQEILDQFLICLSERAIVRDYCHSIDLAVLQRISLLLLQMGNLKECQDYCDFVDNIMPNNSYNEAVAVSYYIRAKLLIGQKNDEQADEYFQKAINYLKDKQLCKRIELLRIYSDYEDFCLKQDRMEQAINCRNEYLRISSYLFNEILKIREIVSQEEEQLILEGKFKCQN